MESRRRQCSRACLLLCLGLLWPSLNGCARQGSSSLWLQAWPPDSSSGSVRMPGGHATSGGALDMTSPPAPSEAEWTPGLALPAHEDLLQRESAWQRVNAPESSEGFVGRFSADDTEATAPAPSLPAVAVSEPKTVWMVYRRALMQSPLVAPWEDRGLAPAPAPDQAAYLLVVLEVHGANIQPFGYQDRADFLVALDNAIDDITLDNIELLAVEEFLPASGPSAESLMNLFGTNGVFKSPKASPGTGPPAPPPAGMLAAIKLAGQPASPLANITRASGRRRTLLQSTLQSGQLTVPPSLLTEPVVRVTLRISTTVGLAARVQDELQRAVQNDTLLAASLRAKGHDVSAIYVNSVTSSLAPIGGPSIAPALAMATSPQTSPPTVIRSNKSGVTSAGAADFQGDRTANGTTIGVSIGVGVPVLLGAVGVALYLLVFRRSEDLRQGVKAAKSRHWAAEAPDPYGFLMKPQPKQFKNPLYPRKADGNDHGGSSSIANPLVALAGGLSRSNGFAPGLLFLPGARISSETSVRGDTAAERDGSGNASVSGKDKAEWGEGDELVAFADLKFSRVIGEGSFGRVFLGKWRETTVAIKLLSQPLVPPGSNGTWDMGESGDSFTMGACHRHGRAAKAGNILEELRKEAKLMAVLRHPNIVMFLGACSSPPCMVTEFCARGSLLDILSRARDNSAAAAELGWNRRLNMALEAAKGMLYLHSRAEAVLHRDLKSANLLVDKHWRVKVADFNLSRVMNASAVVSSVSATNPRWMAPEVLAGKSYDCAADVFSFGIILWELLTWRIPWEDLGPWQVVILVVDQMQRPELPADPAQLPGKPLRHISSYLDLMCQCWHQEPAQRPTFDCIISQLRALIEAESQPAAAPSAAEQFPAASSLQQPGAVATSSPPAATATGSSPTP